MALKTRLKLRIRTKMILTLSGLSLLPLILFMLIWYFTMKNLNGKVEESLIKEAKSDLVRLVEDQASITNAMLDKIKTETHMMAQLAADLWISRNAKSRRSYSSYSLAPDVPINNEVRTELKRLSNLDDFFVDVHKNDPNLFRTYIATKSGMFREYPWDLSADAPLLFSLDVKFENDKIPQDLQRRLRLSSNAGLSFPTEEGISEWLITDLDNDRTYSVRKEGDELRVYDETDASLLTIDMNSKDALRDGKIPHELKEQFEVKGITLSATARVSFSAKGKEKWLVTDEDNGRVYSVREEEGRLNIYEEYDPRIRPWYRRAKEVGKGEVSWEKYINWSAEGVPFDIEPEFEDDLNKKIVTPELRQRFRKADRPLSEKVTISIEEDGVWHVMNNRSYTVRKGYTLNTYDNTGAKLFDIVLEFENDLNKKVVTPELRQRFRKEKKPLSESATVSVEEGGVWHITDSGRIYIIKKENALNVYNAYILTCSEPVFAPDGKNIIGVVAADITLDAVSRRIIRTPEDVEGYAFLLDQDGRVIDQEKSDMFIPQEQERRNIVRNPPDRERQPIEYDEKGEKNYATYAPITCIQSSVNSSPWILGIVMEEKEMIRVAETVKRAMNYTQVLLIGLFIVILLAVSDIAYRMSRRITKPILDLDEGAKIVGSGNLDYQLEVRTGDEIEDLANAFNKMTGDLKAYMKDLEETTAARERIHSELRIASEIQASMLPRTFPPFPDRKEFDIFATMEPAKEVGGDFYDFFFIDEDKLCFLIGDVSGKGVPAALFMAISRILLKTEALRGIPPHEILYNVNNTLCPDNDASMFVTLFCVILNAETGEMQFANAGHNPPLISANGKGFEFIQLPKSFVVGPMPDTEYKSQKLNLKPSDTIFLYTDGVTEAMNPDNQLFSDERLEECLSGLNDKSVEEIIRAVREQIAEFAQGALQSDDITMLALKYNG